MKDYVIKATSGNGEIRAYVGNTREILFHNLLLVVQK